MSAQRGLREADYQLTEEQEALRDTFAAFLTRECPTSRVRESEPAGFDGVLWRRMIDMRAVAMGLGEQVGGDGAGLPELALVVEEIGRRLAPVPLIEAVVATRTLASVGGPSSEEWLQEAVDGRRLITLALHPGAGLQLVPAAAVADGVIGLVGGTLVLTPIGGSPQRPANQGHTPMAWWDLSDRDSEPLCLAEGQNAIEAFGRALQEWKVLMASALIGMARGVLDIAVEHARSRVAFGAPIGTYQAVSHALVNISMGVETGRRLVRKASWYAEHDPGEAGPLAPMAYLYAEETAAYAAATGVHVLGGVGFTVESDAQLYLRRVKGWTLVAGDPDDNMSEIADVLYGAARSGH